MSTLASNISTHLLTRDEVQESFRRAHFRLAAWNLGHILNVETFIEPQWPSLLSWASVLSQSDKDQHVELALEASISALLTANSDVAEAHQAAAYILESCSNLPTLELAYSRGIVRRIDEFANASERLKSCKRRLNHFIFDDFEEITLPVTCFQENIWQALQGDDDVAFSAPTSAGKSYILMQWLASSLAKSNNGSVFAYIVPSRALITQVKNDLVDKCTACKIFPRIVTLPTLFKIDNVRNTILVMTQERIERLFSVANLKLDSLIVDEAHKLGEGSRGVVLQRVIDEALSRNASCKVIMAAPHAKNAGILLPRSSGDIQDFSSDRAISDSSPTVLQNLFWITQTDYKPSWNVTLVRNEETHEIGSFKLPTRLTGKKKILAALSKHLGGCEGGNIVYTNGPAEAENVALLISDTIKDIDGEVIVDPQVTELIKLIRDSIHPSYPLTQTLPVGVGFHYGDMPEIARREQERLFNEGKLSFLVCTSTLLEGVNLPCRNLFIWGPRQGNGKPMTEHAFWNLAGRAGRWGREFSGNIFCVDVHDEAQWPHGAPRRRYAQQVKHAGAELLNKLNEFATFASSSEPLVASRKNRYFEQVLGELVSARLSGPGIPSVGWAQWCDASQVDFLLSIADGVIRNLHAPSHILRKHRGINPVLISDFVCFLTKQPAILADSFMPMTPDILKAKKVLCSNMEYCEQFLGSDFGSPKQISFKAMIALDWILGKPLGYIINKRLDYVCRSGDCKISAEIRNIMDIINTNARYLIPKYLSCYSDCVAFWFENIQRYDLVADVKDIQDMLETGVAERTMIALIGLGLSRTAAVEISSHIPSSELSVAEVIMWLKGRNLAAYSISPVIVREVNKMLESTEFM